MPAFLRSVLFVALAVAPAAAVPSYTEKLYVDMKAALEPDRPNARKLVFVISGTHGDPAQWMARQVRKRLPDGRRTLTVFLEPESVKGIAFLTWERKDQPTVDWVYLAPLRRIVKDVDLEALPVLYSEFTFADIGVIKLGERQLTLLGAEQRAGKKVLKVQEVPREPRPYVRILTWFAAESSLPMDREFYDAADVLFKTQRFETTVSEGIPTLSRIRIENKLEGSHTELHVSEVRADVDVPDQLFDPSKLGQVADDPFWQALAVSPAPAPPAPANQ